MKRRRFLGLCGVAGVGGVSAMTLYDDGVAAGAPAFPRSAAGHPRLREDDGAEWSILDEATRTVSGGKFGVDVSATISSTLFSYDAASEHAAARTDGAFDRSVVLASLSRIDLDSYVNLAVTADRIEGQVLPAVESQLRERDVGEVDYERTTLADDLRGVQRTYDVGGTMGVGPISYDDPDAPDVSVDVPGFDLDVAGVVALWKASVGTVYVLGGVYPAASVTRTATATAEGPDGEHHETDREVTMEFEPATYRDALLSLLDDERAASE
ncbi:hypothetical protein [Halomarina rubra]|uniref:Uncharacterized protein n=1 Tax=Halomarina rubra TaxID=2071873 RepID=A0ABD6AQ68_9EURY|nr:hypothetical protein [Halomarina rubra]